VLIAGKDGFDSENDGTISGQSALFDERCGIALSAGQCMIVADQDNVGGVQSSLNRLRVEQRIVTAKGLVEFAQIFTAAMRILGADFTLYSSQRV